MSAGRYERFSQFVHNIESGLMLVQLFMMFWPLLLMVLVYQAHAAGRDQLATWADPYPTCDARDAYADAIDSTEVPEWAGPLAFDRHIREVREG